MNKKLKKVILKGIIFSLISIPMCAKIIDFSKYEGNVSQHDYYFSKGENSYPGTLIRLGNIGENVSKVQRRLNELGFDVGSADGIFGEKTKQAVVNFQKSKNLNSDGIVGSLTWKALFESVNSYQGILIRLGSSGQDVVKLQQRLNELGFNVGSVDGIFGNLTKTAVMNFQRNKGLEVDGIVGQMTWNLLFSSSEAVIPDAYDKDDLTVQVPPDLIDKDINNSIMEERQRVINYAYNYIGCPYKFGATGPDSFDSSGFTSYIYKNTAGRHIGRTTDEQIRMGKAVEQSELKPGDLVFPHSGHVGIYIGDGKMIHATQTGDVIRITNVYKFYAARRIIQ